MEFSNTCLKFLQSLMLLRWVPKRITICKPDTVCRSPFCPSRPVLPTLDFTLPAFPAQVSISGRVTDSAGRGVNGALVSAFSQTLTGAPNLGFTSSAQTDAGESLCMPGALYP